jgi:hypothetical protein
VGPRGDSLTFVAEEVAIMTNKSIRVGPDIYQWWSQAITSLALRPWRLLHAQYQAGVKLLNALMGSSMARESVTEWKGQSPTPSIPSDFAKLEHAAAERAREGRAPPREVYEVMNRSRIDWSRFPDWARPSDPELFEGCAHEG